MEARFSVASGTDKEWREFPLMVEKLEAPAEVALTDRRRKWRNMRSRKKD